MAENTISALIFCAVIILGIFGVLYMLKDVVLGITLILICGGLIFLRVFINKHM